MMLHLVISFSLQIIFFHFRWLDNLKLALESEEDENISWAAYHSSQEQQLMLKKNV